MNRGETRMNPTTVAISAAVVLLLVCLVGLAVTAKSTVQEIESGGKAARGPAHKEQEQSGGTVTILLIGGIVLGLLFVGGCFLRQVINYRSKPPAPKEAWQKYT